MHVCILLCAQRVFYNPVLSEEKEKINIIITLIYTVFSPHFLFPGLQIPIVRNLLRKSQIFDHHHSHCFTALLSDEGVQKTNKTKTKKILLQLL